VLRAWERLRKVRKVGSAGGCSVKAKLLQGCQSQDSPVQGGQGEAAISLLPRPMRILDRS